MSKLFTHSTALKFVNALDKPPLKLSPRYQNLSTSFMALIHAPMLENHPRGTHLLIYKIYSTFIISGIINPSLLKSFSPVFRMHHRKCFLPSKTFLHTCHFFLSLFHFHHMYAFLNQVRLAHAWFLEIAFVREVGMLMWMCVYIHPRGHE